MTIQKWITAKQMAEHLGISLRALRRFTNQGKIPHVRLGRAIRYSVAAVDEALLRQNEGSQEKDTP